MKPSIYVAVACHNRKRVAELCLPTLRDSMHPDDCLALYNDGSAEYDAAWLKQFWPSTGTNMVSETYPAIGIQAQRRMHIWHFLNISKEASCLYMTDHDCVHSPVWRDEALRLQDVARGAPLCLYNTAAHVRLDGNTIEDNPESEVIWRRVAPGVSYLLTRDHVEKLQPFLSGMEHFDWQIPAIVGPFAVSRVGYVDHIGWGGCRHPENEGPDGGDRVLNPVLSLVAKRAEIVAALSQ